MLAPRRSRKYRAFKSSVIVSAACLLLPNYAQATDGKLEERAELASEGIKPDGSLRLESVGFRLSAANSDRCASPTMMTGMILHDIARYAESDRPDVTAYYNLSYGFGVLRLVPQSPAETAGIRVGDEIVSVNGRNLQAFGTSLAKRRGSYDRTEAFLSLINDAGRSGPINFLIRRGSSEISLSVSPVEGCVSEFILKESGGINAWTDGKRIAVTDSMVSRIDDDAELAFVVAHEMAHNLLGHAVILKGVSPLLAEFGIGARKVKTTEIEADKLAIELMSKAGYDLTAPERILRRFSKYDTLNLAITHPRISRRIAIVNDSRARVEERNGVASHNLNVIRLSTQTVTKSH